MAMCDASYNFVIVDIGAPGKCSDGGVFSSSDMGKGFLQNTLNFPTPNEIDSVNGPIPYYAVADEAFPLLENLMRPFPGRGKRKLPLDESVFNYRLKYYTYYFFFLFAYFKPFYFFMLNNLNS